MVFREGKYKAAGRDIFRFSWMLRIFDLIQCAKGNKIPDYRKYLNIYEINLQKQPRSIINRTFNNMFDFLFMRHGRSVPGCVCNYNIKSVSKLFYICLNVILRILNKQSIRGPGL